MATREINHEVIAKKGDLSAARKQAFLQAPVKVSDPELLPRGHVALRDKKVPTCDLLALHPECKDMQPVTMAGRIEPELLQRLQRRLAEGGEAIWTPEGQDGNAINAPPLRRAYHDSLGINKIILAFSDDLLTQCFRMPWWYAWMDELLGPIFAQIGVDPRLVVRCLLARMPADCLIDIHHDTGRWTTQTHRMHIPVVTKLDRVSFCAGLTPESMERYHFPEGYCLELNNRAKHAVYNGWDQFRIHLIFDWVEDLASLVPALVFRDLTLSSGVVQHRRAIWFYDQDLDPASFPDVPALDVPAAQRRASWSKLLQSSPTPLSSDASFALRDLIRQFDLGELLLEEFISALKPFPGNGSSQFKACVADCVSDHERRFAWLTSE